MAIAATPTGEQNIDKHAMGTEKRQDTNEVVEAVTEEDVTDNPPRPMSARHKRRKFACPLVCTPSTKKAEGHGRARSRGARKNGA